MKINIPFSMACLFTVWAGPVLAESAESDVSACLTLQDNRLRLECYDDAAGFEPKSPAPAVAVTPWAFHEQRDEFTNKNTSFISIDSDKAFLSITDAPKSLVVRCDGDGGTEVFVVSGGYIGARNDRIPVRYKFGNNDPISEYWHESTKGTAAFLPSGYRDFRAGLESGQGFLFEMTDFRGVRESAHFENGPLTGENIEFVWNGCRPQD